MIKFVIALNEQFTDEIIAQSEIDFELLRTEFDYEPTSIEEFAKYYYDMN